MTRTRSFWMAATMAALGAGGLGAQSAPTGYLAEWNGQFDASARKLVALAEAMPAEAWSWRPADGVASVAEVYMHIARYNYFYLDTSLGVEPGAGVDYERLEGVVNDRDEGLRALAASMDHVRRATAAMSASDMEDPAVLYGREVGEHAVLLQLLAHMNEHLGQSIAYARMNGVVPPWSR